MYVKPGKRKVIRWKIRDWPDDKGKYITGFDKNLGVTIRSSLIKELVYDGDELVGAKTISGSEYEFVKGEDK